MQYVLGLRYRVLGREHLSQAPVLYAVKHQSSWETLILLLHIHNGVFILKRELLSLPFLGWYLRKTGQIAIDRNAGVNALRSVLRHARQAVGEGFSPIIFPEGTRVLPDEKKDYQSGIAALYQDLNLPVVPIALNSGLFWPKNSFLKKSGTVSLQILERIEPGLPRRAFMAELEKRIEEASGKLRGTDV